MCDYLTNYEHSRENVQLYLQLLFKFFFFFTLINTEWIILEMHKRFHNVCYCCLISVRTETHWQVYWRCQISYKFITTVLMVLQQREERQDKINRHLFFLASLHCALAKCYPMLPTTVNTFAASYLKNQGLNNSCLKSPASTLVDLTFQPHALRSFSLNQLYKHELLNRLRSTMAVNMLRIHLKEPQISTMLEIFDPKNIRMQAEMPDMLTQRFPNFFARRPLLASKSNHGSSHTCSHKYSVSGW